MMVENNGGIDERQLPVDHFPLPLKLIAFRLIQSP
jgi:hypothetical protein